eukprot:tig00020904_g15221.t1
MNSSKKAKKPGSGGSKKASSSKKTQDGALLYNPAATTALDSGAPTPGFDGQIGGAWLQQVVVFPGSVYIPQVGDVVMYMRQGHEWHLKTFPDKELPRPSKLNLPYELECRVSDMSFKPDLSKKLTYVHIRLDYLGPNYEPGDRFFPYPPPNPNDPNQDPSHFSFTVAYHFTSLADFLILKSKYDSSINKWRAGMRFSQPFDVGTSEASWYSGVVMERSPTVPNSSWECLKVQWDEPQAGDYELARVSPWEIVPWSAERVGPFYAHEELKRREKYDPPPRMHPEDEAIAMEVIEDLLQQAQAGPFLEKVELPLYRQTIACPLDLGIVRQRLAAHYYRQIDALLFDLHHIFMLNCRAFNDHASLIVKDAEQLFTHYKRTLCTRIWARRHNKQVQIAPFAGRLAGSPRLPLPPLPQIDFAPSFAAAQQYAPPAAPAGRAGGKASSSKLSGAAAASAAAAASRKRGRPGSGPPSPAAPLRAPRRRRRRRVPAAALGRGYGEDLDDEAELGEESLREVQSLFGAAPAGPPSHGQGQGRGARPPSPPPSDEEAYVQWLGRRDRPWDRSLPPEIFAPVGDEPKREYVDEDDDDGYVPPARPGPRPRPRRPGHPRPPPRPPPRPGRPPPGPGPPAARPRARPPFPGRPRAAPAGRAGAPAGAEAPAAGGGSRAGAGSRSGPRRAAPGALPWATRRPLVRAGAPGGHGHLAAAAPGQAYRPAAPGGYHQHHHHQQPQHQHRPAGGYGAAPAYAAPGGYGAAAAAGSYNSDDDLSDDYDDDVNIM